MIPLLLLYSLITFPSMLILSRKRRPGKECALFFVLSTCGLLVWLSIALRRPFSPDNLIAWLFDLLYQRLL